MMVTDDMMLARVDAFLAATGMAPTRLGIAALGDGGLVRGLREGRSLSLRNAERLVRFMTDYRAGVSAVGTGRGSGGGRGDPDAVARADGGAGRGDRAARGRVAIAGPGR